MRKIITLLTDFGLEDHFVGSLKGVILSINPQAAITDITHLIRPQNITEGAWVLREVYARFPKGTIHVAVVDPGVGSTRRALCVQTPRGFLLGPDNGLLSLALDLEKTYEARHITNDRYFLKPVSHTFHGRDIFSPVAAHLSRRNIFSSLGPVVRSIEHLRLPKPRTVGKRLRGEVIYIDRFGNGLTNVTRADTPRSVARISIGSQRLSGIKRWFAEGNSGELIAIWSSSGFLEFAVPNGSAREKFNIREGITFWMEFKES